MLKKLCLVASCAVIIAVMTAAPSWAFWGKYSSVAVTEGTVRVSAADLERGRAHFYKADIGGKDIAFFLVRDMEGNVRAAFDACDVCFHAKKGYSEGKNALMICNQCGMRFPVARIGFEKGGCNPAPLAMALDGESVIVRADDLAAGARFF